MSQLYLDDFHHRRKQSPYNGMGYRTTTNDKDFVFRRGGKQLMLTLTKDGQRYAANFERTTDSLQKTRTILRSQERETPPPFM
jgi:hypothetical protein